MKIVKIIRKTPKIDKLEKQVKYLQKHGVKVGVFGEKAERTQNGVKVVEYAVYLNYGTVFMPARPFFDKAVNYRKGRSEIVAEQKRILSDVYYNGLSGNMALTQLGVFIQQKIKEQILSNNFAPLKDSTVKRKERNTNSILRENDFLLNSIHFEIVKI